MTEDKGFKFPTLYKDGKFLGRTGASWAKITGFYCIYYTFLALLIFYSVTLRESHLSTHPGDRKAPMIVTRTDSPGASVYPFHSISSSIDGDGLIDFSMDNQKKAAANKQAYINAMEAFANQTSSEIHVRADNTEITKEIRNCADKSVDVQGFTCEVPNAATLQTINNTITFQKALEDESPFFTVNLNKIWNWTPVNNAGLGDAVSRETFNKDGELEPASNQEFTRNSIEMECFEVTKKDGRIENSNFEVTLIGETSIKPYYFPYIGQDLVSSDANEAAKSGGTAVAYNKPFLIGRVESKTDKAWDGGMKLFRCELSAANIQKPLIGKAFENADKYVKSWSNDLTKLGLGFVEFGFQFRKKSS